VASMHPVEDAQGEYSRPPVSGYLVEAPPQRQALEHGRRRHRWANMRVEAVA